MPVGFAQIRANYDGFRPVANTEDIVTYDFEDNQTVVIIASVPPPPPSVITEPPFRRHRGVVDDMDGVRRGQVLI